MDKTEFAFRCSAEKLFEREGPIYFWTFTMTQTIADWCYSGVWKYFVRELSDLYGGTLKGLKVIELHKEHGIHWHALLNKRIWVGRVRRIGSRFGIGRIEVERVRSSGATITYLTKYLSKDFRESNQLFSKCSRWGTIGGFIGTRVRDVEIDSLFHRRVKFCQEVTGMKQLGYLFTRMVYEWHGSKEQLRQAAMRYLATGCISGLMARAGTEEDWQD